MSTSLFDWKLITIKRLMMLPEKWLQCFAWKLISDNNRGSYCYVRPLITAERLIVVCYCSLITTAELSTWARRAGWPCDKPLGALLSKQHCPSTTYACTQITWLTAQCNTCITSRSLVNGWPWTTFTKSSVWSVIYCVVYARETTASVHISRWISELEKFLFSSPTPVSFSSKTKTLFNRKYNSFVRPQ